MTESRKEKYGKHISYEELLEMNALYAAAMKKMFDGMMAIDVSQYYKDMMVRYTESMAGLWKL